MSTGAPFIGPAKKHRSNGLFPFVGAKRRRYARADRCLPVNPMPASFVADLEEIVYPSSFDDADTAHLMCIAALRVLPGMFVAELDRPWNDTPLQQGGLLICNDEELAAIRTHCRHVHVDPARSGPEMLDAIKAAAVLSGKHVLALADDPWEAAPACAGAESPVEGASGHDAPGAVGARSKRNNIRHLRSRGSNALLNAPAERRDDVHPTNEARGRLRALLLASEGKRADERSSAVARLRNWLSVGSDGAQPHLRGLDELRERYGETIGAVEPAEPARIRDTFPQARSVHARLVAAADTLVAQVRQGATPTLESLDEPIDHFIATLQHAPDALRWVEALYVQNAPRPNPATAVALNLAGFGRSLGMPAQTLRELTRIGLLLDLGKALLPHQLLEQPGVLAPHDYALVQQHVTIGLDLLERAGTLDRDALRAIAEHHERLDGSGYPRQLRGDAIGLLGRMAAIVDTFSGLTAVRAYANPLSVEDALAALNEWAGSLFCRDLVERLILSVRMYPVGTMVELRSGEIAAVIDHPHGERTSPRLFVMTSTDKGPLRVLRDRTGRQRSDNVSNGTQVRITRGLPTGAYGLRLPDYYGQQRPMPDSPL